MWGTNPTTTYRKLPAGASYTTSEPSSAPSSAAPRGEVVVTVRAPGARLLGVLGQQVGLVVGVVLVEGADRDEHPGPDRGGVDGRLDDLRVAQHVLELADLGLHQPLLVLGGVVLGVLLEVAVLARDLDLLGDLLPPRRGQLLQLGLDPQVGVQREGGRGLLPGLAGGSVAELVRKFCHAGSLPRAARAISGLRETRAFVAVRRPSAADGRRRRHALLGT